MMNFIRSWNRFFFKESLNVFDVICLLTIVNLMVNFSYWWMLAYAITIPASVHMQRRLGLL